jgi:hypothetical protein
MEITDISINQWITMILIIAQGGIVYYRLKKVEQSTERFNDLFIEFAVHKNTFKNHLRHFEKQSIRVENVIEKLDNRISGIEAQAYESFVKNKRKSKDY